MVNKDRFTYEDAIVVQCRRRPGAVQRAEHARGGVIDHKSEAHHVLVGRIAVRKELLRGRELIGGPRRAVVDALPVAVGSEQVVSVDQLKIVHNPPGLRQGDTLVREFRRRRRHTRGGAIGATNATNTTNTMRSGLERGAGVEHAVQPLLEIDEVQVKGAVDFKQHIAPYRKETPLFVLSFPYVCPEPVLVKRCIL